MVNRFVMGWLSGARLLGVCLLGTTFLMSGVVSAQDDDDAEIDADMGIGEEEAIEGSSESSFDDTYTLGQTPSIYGATGLYHMATAQTGPEMTYRLGLFAQYFTASDVVRTNDENTRFIGSLAFSVTPLDWLEPYAVLLARSNSNTFTTPETVLAQGDLILGTKAVFPLEKAIHVGGNLQFISLTGAGSTTFDFAATSLKIAALGTFDATELDESAPVKAHLSIGYFLDNSDQILPEDSEGRKLIPSRVERFAQGTSAFDQVQFGLGVEFPLDYVTPHVEYNLGILVGDEPVELCENQPLECPASSGFAGNPQTVTLGVKGEPAKGLILNGGVDIGLSSEDVQGVPTTAPYNMVFGLSYVFDPRPQVIERIVEKEMPVEMATPSGYVLGKVVDSTTGKPISGAMISYSVGEFTRQASDSKTGAFRSYALDGPPAELQLEISHPDYKTARVTQAIKVGENAVEVKLKPAGETGVMEGSVKMPGGGTVSGKVVLTGPKVYETTIEKGKFTQTVLVGAYTVAATVPGFMTGGKDLKVSKGSKAPVNIELKKRPAFSSVTVSGTKVLVDGIIPFTKDPATKNEVLGEGAREILDQVAATLFEHPEFARIRVESHVDDKGSEVDKQERTDRRALLVRNYISSQGVAPARLEAKGFGSKLPLVPNSSKENREINQRIEFTIVSTSKR